MDAETEEGLHNRSNDCESAIKSGHFPSYACLNVSHCTWVIERYWLLQQNYYCNRIVKKCYALPGLIWYCHELPFWYLLLNGFFSFSLFLNHLYVSECCLYVLKRK